MGILDDFKKLFWVKKAVAKSAAKKVGDEAKEMAEEGYEKVKQFSSKVADKAEDAFDDAKDFTSDLMDDIWKKKETAAPPVKNTPGDTPPSEKTETLVEKAVKMSDKTWEKAEEVGEKVRDKAEDLAGKAKEAAKKVSEKIEGKVDEMLVKAKELDKKIEEERDAIDANRDGYADKPVNEKLREQGSLLKDKDDFWSKADQYSKGDYSMGKPVVVGKDDPDTLDLKPLKNIKGQGDDLIDDAEVVSDGDIKKNDDSDKDPDETPGEDDTSTQT